MTAPIPVIILTGFLGSGKTTVLNRLLRHPGLTDTAIIVNEFGEIGLDHLLVESAADQMVLMDNGCLCCSVRGDLADTLTDLIARADAGLIPSFSRVIVETTGLADPAPIAQELLANPALSGKVRLKAIVATVDALVGVSTLEGYDEARCQVAMADLVLVTKTDLPGADPARAEAAVRGLNPGARSVRVADGAVEPDVILSTETLAAPEAGMSGGEAACAVCGHDHAGHGQTGDGHTGHGHTGDGHTHHDHAHHDHAGHSHAGAHHGWNIQTASLVIDAPLRWEVVAGWLEWITALRGPDLLRIKGILAVEGAAGPVLVQGVQQVFSPPMVLPDWPDADHRSRIVLIARDIPQAALRASLDRFRQVG